MWRISSSLRSCGAVTVGACVVQKTRCEDGDLFGTTDQTEPLEDFGLSPSSLEGSTEIKAPGQFEQWDGEVKRLTGVHTFKGAKVDITKPLSPNFMIRHAIQLGDSPMNPNANEHYSFMAQVFNDTGVAMSTLDQYGALESQFILPTLPFNKNMSSKLILYFGQGDMFWNDIDYNGDTFNTQFRWGANVMGWQGKMAHFAYTQAITPTLSLAAACGLQNDLTSPTSETSIKLDRQNDCMIAGYKSHMQPCQKGEDGMMEVNLAYHRKVVKDRVNLAASLQLIPMAMHAASTFGAEFQLHQSTVNTSFCPSAGKLATTVQSKLSQGMNMSFSLEGIFGQQNPQTGEKADAFRFGCGLSLG
jgi:hypothetical protein